MKVLQVCAGSDEPLAFERYFSSYFYVNGSLRPYVLPGRLILLPVIVSIALVGFLFTLLLKQAL
jgi:hypothetical protein